QAEIDAVHCLDVIHRALEQAFLDREPDFEVLDFEQRRADFIARRAAAGLRAEQFPSVRMLRRTEQLCARCLFDDATALHDTYAMRNSSHQVQIVTDQ